MASPATSCLLPSSKCTAAEACTAGLLDLPEVLLELIFASLPVADCAASCCVSRGLRAVAKDSLAHKTTVTEADFTRLLSLQAVLVEGEKNGTVSAELRRRACAYLPAAVHYTAAHCPRLQSLSLTLPPTVSSKPAPGCKHDARAAEASRPQAAACLYALAAHCADLRRLRLVNLPSQMITVDTFCLPRIAERCRRLERLAIGRQGGEESVYDCLEPYYSGQATNFAMRALAQHCLALQSLELLRCNRVTDDGLLAIAARCRGLRTLTLHDCPEISERGIIQVVEACTGLERFDIRVARRRGDLLLWDQALGGGDQLGFGALFALAANCRHLRELAISQEHLEVGIVDDACLLPVLEGCRELRRLSLRHCEVSDATLLALAGKSKYLEDLELVGAHVGDEGITAVAAGCPRLRRLFIRTGAATALRYVPAGMHTRSITDASAKAITQHCKRLIELDIIADDFVMTMEEND